MENENINQEFQELIDKYLNHEISSTEMKKLINYYESFQKSNEWPIELEPEAIIKQKIFQSILNSISKDTASKVIPFYRRKIFHYVAAASVVFLIGLSYFFNENQTDVKLEETMVDKSIEAGSGKAILTLDNGKEINLVKGQNYISSTVESDGEKLVYHKEVVPSENVGFNYITVPRGGEFFIELVDGTKVWLNSESKLKYPVGFIKGQAREVELVYGEAYFEVTSSEENNNNRFIVVNANQDIEVLGTKFNIKAFKEQNAIYTTLVEGKIKLTAGDNKKILKPGQQSEVGLGKGDIILRDVDPQEEIAWIMGDFIFKRKSLKEVMAVLSRWYDVEVVYGSHVDSAVKFTGDLSKYQNLEAILHLIKETNKINSYEIKNNTVYLE